MNNITELFDENFINEIAPELKQINEIQIDVDQQLASALQDYEAVKKEIGAIKTSTVLEMCRDSVLTNLLSHFGVNRLVAMRDKDGGNVTTTHNFKKGITATEADAEKYEEWNYIANEGGFNKENRRNLYDKRKNQMRENDIKAGKIAVTDEYTGKTISIKRADVDHIVSAKEVETDAKNNLYLNQEERVALGTDDKNLAYTKDKANRSKGAKAMKDFLDKEKPDGRTNEEVFGIDRNRALEKDKVSRNNISKTVTIAAFKKNSLALLQTGAAVGGQAMLYSAVGAVMTEFVGAAFDELIVTFKNRDNKTPFQLVQEFTARLKKRMAEVAAKIKANWTHIIGHSFEGAIINFLHNLLIFVINMVATTLKNIVTMIRAGFTTVWRRSSCS